MTSFYEMKIINSDDIPFSRLKISVAVVCRYFDAHYLFCFRQEIFGPWDRGNPCKLILKLCLGCYLFCVPCFWCGSRGCGGLWGGLRGYGGFHVAILWRGCWLHALLGVGRQARGIRDFLEIFNFLRSLM